MRSWAIVVTVFYAVIVFLLLSFGASFLADGRDAADAWARTGVEEFLFFLLPVALLLAAQLLLIFLSVDTSWRRLRPQRHAKVTAGLIGLMVAILLVSALLAFGLALWGDGIDAAIGGLLGDTWVAGLSGRSSIIFTLVIVALIWVFWGAVFHAFSKRASNVVESAVHWLIQGSVLELLIAVPCHIVIRQREWCCAQYISAWGIATGIAIMLMAFGPGALLLYKRKLDDYKMSSSDTEPDSD